MASAPITVDELKQTIPYIQGQGVVAVSGGIDSITLAFLLSKTGISIKAVVVDHGLRTNSSLEASEVKNYLNTFGLEAIVLKWAGAKPDSAIQEKAREARYSLMLEYCQSVNAKALFLGHNLNDNIETFLQRLIKGSGIHGLSAMRPVATSPFIIHNNNTLYGNELLFIRPLLAFSRERIEATAQAHNLTWFEDHTNASGKYQRNRLRLAMNNMEEIGLTMQLTMQRLNQSINAIQSADDALENEATSSFDMYAKIHDSGYCTLNIGAINSCSYEILRRLVLKLLHLTGNRQEVRHEKLAVLLDWMMSKPKQESRTLAGIEIIAHNKDTFLFVRELKAEPVQLQTNTQRFVFDSRFTCVNNSAAEGNFIAAYLGKAGWANLPEDFRKSINIKPKRIIYSYPAIFCGDAPIAVPHLAYKVEGYEKHNFTFQLINSPQKLLSLVSAVQ